MPRSIERCEERTTLCTPSLCINKHKFVEWPLLLSSPSLQPSFLFYGINPKSLNAEIERETLSLCRSSGDEFQFAIEMIVEQGAIVNVQLAKEVPLNVQASHDLIQRVVRRNLYGEEGSLSISARENQR